MCDVATMSAIEEVVHEKVATGAEFTAHDITREVRKRLPGENIPHNEVRNEVHKMFMHDQIPNYSRRTGNFSNVQGQQPMVFYPTPAGVDPTVAVNPPSTSSDGTLDDTDSPVGGFFSGAKKVIGMLLGQKTN